MSIIGDIVEERYDKLINNYRIKLKKFCELLSNEYPQAAEDLLEEFDNHFNIPKSQRT